jgi:branched-chain amino acid transport system permease protein
MVVVGGMGSLFGAVIGVVSVSALTEILRRLQAGEIAGLDLPAGTQQVVLAAVLLAVLIARPGGLTGGREASLPRPASRDEPYR